MMERYRQLNHALEMPAKTAARCSLPPHVFEGLMSVEEAGGIEHGQSAMPVLLLNGFHSQNKGNTAFNYVFSYLTLTALSRKLYLFCLVIANYTEISI
jgi:hypothetical protein